MKHTSEPHWQATSDQTNITKRHTTQAKPLDEVMKRIKEAIEACLEVEGPKSRGRTELVGVQFVEVQA